MESPTLENSICSVRKCDIVAVEFPALVNNKDRMLKMINGEAGVSAAYQSSTKRLELRWRPEDIYCKSAYGDRVPTTGLLMKVTRRKIRGPDGVIHWTMEADLAGPVMCIYKFNGMADYQFLPMARTGNRYVSLRKDLVIDKLEHSSWIKKPAPLFLTPIFFSRIDQSISYSYRKEPTKRTDSTLPQNLLGVSRERRLHHTITYCYGDPIPQQPLPDAWNNLSEKERCNENMLKLRQLFEERPIWSRNSILLRLSDLANKMKFMLPVVAYYCSSGPWRTLWVRYGYDPTTNPEAKIYQTLDYRIRQRAGEKILVNQPKRSPFFYANPTKKSKKQVASRTSHFKSDQETPAETHHLGESVSVFRPGVLPPYRQMFYQICDVLSDEVQTELHANDGKEEVCTEKDGWGTPDMIANCRAVVGKYVDAFREKNPILEFHTSRKHERSRRAIESKRKLQPATKMTKNVLDDAETDDEEEVEEGNADDQVDKAEEEEGDFTQEMNLMETEILEQITGIDMSDT